MWLYNQFKYIKMSRSCPEFHTISFNFLHRLSSSIFLHVPVHPVAGIQWILATADIILWNLKCIDDIITCCPGYCHYAHILRQSRIFKTDSTTTWLLDKVSSATACKTSIIQTLLTFYSIELHGHFKVELQSQLYSSFGKELAIAYSLLYVDPPLPPTVKFCKKCMYVLAKIKHLSFMNIFAISLPSSGALVTLTGPHKCTLGRQCHQWLPGVLFYISVIEDIWFSAPLLVINLCFYSWKANYNNDILKT